MTDPFERWRMALADWKLPDEILRQAPESPWIHPVELFDVSSLDEIPDSPSHAAARAVSPASVLDIGCGGGRAAFACVPPATHVIGVDHQQGMLDSFAAVAERREVTCETYLGDWPDVAAQVPIADVATCHHVFYNVSELRPFVTALSSHARKRVVVELPLQHPLTNLAPWWKQFWDLDRPSTPTAVDAKDCVESLGYDVMQIETVAEDRTPVDEDLAVKFMRIRLCLPASRDAEIREFMHALPPQERVNVTLYWDV